MKASRDGQERRVILLGVLGLERNASQVKGTTIIRNKDWRAIRDHRRIDHGSDEIRVGESREEPAIGPRAESPADEARLAPGGENAERPSSGAESKADLAEPAAEAVSPPTPSKPVAAEAGVGKSPSGPEPPPTAAPTIVDVDVDVPVAAEPTAPDTSAGAEVPGIRPIDDPKVVSKAGTARTIAAQARAIAARTGSIITQARTIAA